MLSFNLLAGVSLIYVAFLFGVAWAADRAAGRGGAAWLRSPVIYTLSLSIYCTAWTFYGAVGYAARSGLEFVTIYLGPTIVLIGWWGLLRRLVRIGRMQRITSIADLISSRYGKSAGLGVFVTLLAVVGTTPYIALQLQSVTAALQVFLPPGTVDELASTALWIAAGLAVFTVMFGTRSLDAREQHHGVVTAIAAEAVVKLVALLAVGIFVVFQIGGGPAGAMQAIEAAAQPGWDIRPDRWVTLTFLAGAAFLCLPRMFQVMVVENTGEQHLAVASWAFPLYLFLMSLFVLPIAAVGLQVLPEGSNPDLFVLTIPLNFGREGLAMLSFLGGFSSATSMVIVAAVALSTMVSNHIVMPIWLGLKKQEAAVPGDVRNIVLMARRASIAGVLALGYFYYRLSGGGGALAAIGLISFAGIAQVLPAMLGGIFWRGATRYGAAAGLGTGFAVWLWTLLLPSVGDAGVIAAEVLRDGPWGIGWLRPRALFGIEGVDPLLHSVFWSIGLNTLAFLTVSLLTFPSPLERLQGFGFVNVLGPPEPPRGWGQSVVDADDLLILAQRILGAAEARAIFTGAAKRQGREGMLPDPTPAFLETLERAMAGSVGAATAHAMLAQIAGGASVSVEDLLKVADETQQIMEYSTQLEAKSEELERTAAKLQEVNRKLMALSVQKDSFLSQVSHELRTPMTSIRSFSEILKLGDTLSGEERARYAGIIHDEAIRLTRLLDDILDVSVMEAGKVTLSRGSHGIGAVLERSLSAASPARGALEIEVDMPEEEVRVDTDADRLTQVFLNIIVNASKYCDAEAPRLVIRGRREGGEVVIDFIDNGSGIPEDQQGLIFEKFSRLGDSRAAGGAGLGLAICREIMARLGGEIAYLPGQGGAAFRVRHPLAALASHPV